MSARGGAAAGIAVRGGATMRLRGLVRKEFLQIVRDPSSIAIAFIMPVVLLLLFGYGVSLDVEHVPVAVVVEQPERRHRGLRRLAAGLALFCAPRGAGHAGGRGGAAAQAGSTRSSACAPTSPRASGGRRARRCS